jgi:hypothetical protein
LLDAVNAFAAQSLIKATFTNSMLLLHTEEDPLDPIIEAESDSALSRVSARQFLKHAVFNDADWNAVQPMLRKNLKADIRPWPKTYESWHFYRHSFAAWNLNGIEALRAVALAGKSRATISTPAFHFGRPRIDFACDTRVLAVPTVKEFPK